MAVAVSRATSTTQVGERKGRGSGVEWQIREYRTPNVEGEDDAERRRCPSPRGSTGTRVLSEELPYWAGAVVVLAQGDNRRQRAPCCGGQHPRALPPM